MGNSEAFYMHVWGPVEDCTARLIRQHEGLRLEPYRDTLGHWTIGYGHRLPVEIPGQYRIVKRHAEALLRADICRAIGDVHRWLDGRGDGVEGPRWGVLVDLAFNIGYPKLVKFHRLRAALLSADWGRAAVEMLDSLWAHQVGQRAATDAEIMRTGVWPWKNDGG